MESKKTTKLAPGDKILVRRHADGHFEAATPNTPLLDLRSFAASIEKIISPQAEEPIYTVKFRVIDNGQELPVQIGSEGNLRIPADKDVCLEPDWRKAHWEKRIKTQASKPLTIRIGDIKPGDDLLVRIDYANIGQRPEPGYDPRHDKLSLEKPNLDHDPAGGKYQDLRCRTKHLFCFAAQVSKVTPVENGSIHTRSVRLHLERIDNGLNHHKLPESFVVEASIHNDACIAGTMWRFNSFRLRAGAAR